MDTVHIYDDLPSSGFSLKGAPKICELFLLVMGVPLGAKVA